MATCFVGRQPIFNRSDEVYAYELLYRSSLKNAVGDVDFDVATSQLIMNAFIEIAVQQNTNLAVVAPGIAEALMATGLGLLAAIPAVIFYNKLSADSDQIVAGYEAFADEFATILSRQLDS